MVDERARDAWKRWGLRLAQSALAVAVLYFVYRAVSGQLSSSRFFALHFSVGYLIASWIVIAAYYLAYAGGLTLVVRALGYRAGYRDMFKLSFAANLGKYLPGGVWQVAGKVAMAKQAGIDRHAALVATVVESALSIAGGLLLFLATALFGGPFPAGVPRWPLALALVAIMVVLAPPVFSRLVSAGMRVLRIEGGPPHLRLGPIVWLTLYYTAAWVLAGGAFWLFARSLVGDPGASWLAYGGFYAAANIGGLLVFFVPAGLGAREGVIVLLTRSVIVGGATAAVIVAFASRVWSTIMELVLSAVAVALPFKGTAEADATDAVTDASRRSPVRARRR